MLLEVSHSANSIEILNHSSIYQHILCRTEPEREKERMVFNHTKFTEILLFQKNLILITYDARENEVGSYTFLKVYL